MSNAVSGANNKIIKPDNEIELTKSYRFPVIVASKTINDINEALTTEGEKEHNQQYISKTIKITTNLIFEFTLILFKRNEITLTKIPICKPEIASKWEIPLVW